MQKSGASVVYEFVADINPYSKKNYDLPNTDLKPTTERISRILLPVPAKEKRKETIAAEAGSCRITRT